MIQLNVLMLVEGRCYILSWVQLQISVGFLMPVARDDLAFKRHTESGSKANWNVVVKRKSGFLSSPTIKLLLEIAPEGGRGFCQGFCQVDDTNIPERMVNNVVVAEYGAF